MIDKVVIRKFLSKSPTEHKIDTVDDRVNVSIFPKKGTEAEFVKMFGIRFKVPAYTFTTQIDNMTNLEI